jgi:hypothetical protein
MKNISVIARPVVAALFAIGIAGGCSDLQDSLLEPQQPGTITPEAAASPVGADALRKGALGRLKDATEGGNAGGLWSMAGLLADEWKSGDTFIQRVETDQRLIQNNNVEVIDEFRAQHRARGAARDALNALTTYLPLPAYYQAQMWWVMGQAELQLAENWCDGVPYSQAVAGEPSYAAGLTRIQALTMALAHLDSGAALAVAADTATVSTLRAINIARARAMIGLGNFAGAAAAVAAIPTNFRYNQSHSLTTADVAAWSLNNSQKRWVVGDSFDVSGQILNAIPFASAADPRVPVQGTSLNSSLNRAFDNSTWFVQQTIWARSDALPILSGVDARLIEAENQLQLGNTGVGATQMTGILNTLRASAQSLGSGYSTPVMAALPAPASQAEAAALFFREKAFWQFGRGYRLADMRRMILPPYNGAPYNYTAATVYPGGVFFKTSLPYGSHVVFPITTDEDPNPNYASCDASIP